MTEDGDLIFSFGTWVRRRRKALDLTQAALAQRVGCAEVTIRKLEADAFRPSREIADRLANCLNIPNHEHELFIQAARAERGVDRLMVPDAAIDLVPTQSPAPVIPRVSQIAQRSIGGRDEAVIATQQPVADRKRQAMLTKVKTIWISGVLHHSLYQEVLISLDLTQDPSAVLRPHDLLVQRPGAAEVALPSGTTIAQVFDEAGGELLILGAPGAGKTTLLLELLCDLLGRAQNDQAYPIPVVFPVSTWSQRQLPLAEWLVDELVKRYGVPRKLARVWVDGDQILPLLDGLDEVAQQHRVACVAAINMYREQRGLLPLVVCSRVADYRELTTKLQLQAAVKVQPLTNSHIDVYLATLGSSVAAVQTALQNDPTLRHMLDTPLMLHIITLTYAGLDVATLAPPDQIESRRQQLLAAYVSRMLRRGNTLHRYTPEQTCHWLQWLAWQLQRHNQTVFYVERLQPDWLPLSQQWLPTIGLALWIGLIMGMLGGSVALLADGLMIGVITGMMSTLTVGRFAGYSDEIENVEVLHWSLPTSLYELRLTIVIALLVGLFFGFVSSLLDGLVSGLLVGMVGVLMHGLTHSEIEVKLVPNQGIKRSLRYALTIGLFIGLVFGFIQWLFFGLVDALGYGLFFGLIAALLYGGRSCLQHLALRRLLVHNKFAPWNYPDFLDHAASRILLRKVGGGYIFIHRLVQEYFVDQYTSAHPDAKNTAE